MSTLDIVLLVFTILVLIYRYRTEKRTLEVIEKTESNVLVKVEVINNYIYLWDEISSDFLAQGKTLDDAIKVLELRFPNTKFMMRQSDLAKETLGRGNE